MQNFTTASLKGHRDIEEQILQLQNYINGSRYTVAITGAGISMAAGIMDFAHMNFPLVLQMSSSAVLKSAPNHYYNTARKAFLNAMPRPKSEGEPGTKLLASKAYGYP